MIPYGRQAIDESDIEAVIEALRSDWLTTGPRVNEFEDAMASFTEASHAVAVNSGTAALHCAMHAIGIEPGDEVIVPAMTFVATANCVCYQGGTPVIADVCSETLLIDPEDVRKRITPRTKAVIAVDYAGQPADWDALRSIAKEHGLVLVADGCHALGATDRDRSVGRLADMTTFSFHPVKHITTCEGGMIVTEKSDWADSMRRFRNHGMTTDGRQREEGRGWQYDVPGPGYNYRLSDIQCALGSSQLARLPGWLAHRRAAASKYAESLEDVSGINMLETRPDVQHAWHLLVVSVENSVHGMSRDTMFHELRKLGIGANVHYTPLTNLTRFSSFKGQCPVAEMMGEKILTLPLHQRITEDQIEYVVDSIRNVLLTKSVHGED
ncbi:MAG: UDP-4-amino-4,6-dideoxy-N-acetyl-beta-L-altrosamine transaminase [Phycisphaerae bacterium]|nr:UDP-4-amino-4,6-dideoxy-N-acetyl-beta-L-altrosamine transaminase [Phycisphaerae bacterium]|tara:strand:- start:5 stop:1150 length:1146 start_codon:yes stop_codon:yes gene_type:complete